MDIPTQTKPWHLTFSTWTKAHATCHIWTTAPHVKQSFVTPHSTILHQHHYLSFCGSFFATLFSETFFLWLSFWNFSFCGSFLPRLSFLFFFFALISDICSFCYFSFLFISRVNFLWLSTFFCPKQMRLSSRCRQIWDYAKGRSNRSNIRRGSNGSWVADATGKVQSWPSIWPSEKIASEINVRSRLNNVVSFPIWVTCGLHSLHQNILLTSFMHLRMFFLYFRDASNNKKHVLKKNSNQKISISMTDSDSPLGIWLLKPKGRSEPEESASDSSAGPSALAFEKQRGNSAGEYGFEVVTFDTKTCFSYYLIDNFLWILPKIWCFFLQKLGDSFKPYLLGPKCALQAWNGTSSLRSCFSHAPLPFLDVSV